MAEGAADWEGPALPDAAGGEDDPRAGPDGAPGDGAAAPAGRWRDRRSGVVLPGGAGAPADGDAGLLEAARATPRRSSIIKVSEAAPPRAGAGAGGGAGSAGARHCFRPPPSRLARRSPTRLLAGRGARASPPRQRRKSSPLRPGGPVGLRRLSPKAPLNRDGGGGRAPRESGRGPLSGRVRPPPPRTPHRRGAAVYPPAGRKARSVQPPRLCGSGVSPAAGRVRTEGRRSLSRSPAVVTPAPWATAAPAHPAAFPCASAPSPCLPPTWGLFPV